MKSSVMLTVTSILSILFLTFHMTDDFLRDKHGMTLQAFLITVIFLAAWLYGTLVLVERRWGYILTLLGSLAALGMGILHTMAAGVANSRGFFFIWTLIVLGITGIFSLILSVRGLWSLRGGQPQLARASVSLGEKEPYNV